MKIIAYYIFSLFYYIGCLLPVRSNHYFCVMTHDSSIDSSVGVVIQAIKKEASNPKFILYTKETKTKWGKLSLLFLKPFQLASCKTILMDNEFLPLAYIHLRKDVKVIQLWHGTGTIKKFGHDVCSPSLLKVVQRADDKITHLIVNSEYTKRLYQRTFGLEESRVYLTGIPRTDQLFDMNTMEEKRRNFFSQYPELKDKRLFLYAPTFRDKEVEDPKIKLNIEEWLQRMSEDCILLLKLHPFVANNLKMNHDQKYEKRVFNLSGFSDINTLLYVSDSLITDYSSIIFEYILFDRPIYFLAYDLDFFLKDDRGFYEDYISYVPGPVVKDTVDLIHSMNEKDIYQEKREQFRKESYEYFDGKSTERVLQYIK